MHYKLKRQTWNFLFHKLFTVASLPFLLSFGSFTVEKDSYFSSAELDSQATIIFI